MSEHVRIERDGGVLAITLARPDRRNAITVAMYRALADAVESAAKDDDVRLIGVEPAGKGLNGDEHGATLLRGSPGIIHGAETYVLQDDEGQISESWSVSAGLDYPAVGPQHADL